jgi:hypothetical protein
MACYIYLFLGRGKWWQKAAVCGLQSVVCGLQSTSYRLQIALLLPVDYFVLNLPPCADVQASYANSKKFPECWIS